jgi:MFS family permease
MVVSAILVIPVSVPSKPEARNRPFFQDFKDGWAHLSSGQGKPLLQLAVFSSMQAFFSGAPALLITLAAATLFASSSAAYGILFTLFMAGGVAGGLILGHLNPRRHLGPLLAGALLIEGALLYLTLLLVPNLLASGVGWFAVGIFDVAFYTGYIAYLQAKTPEGLLGRTTSNMYLFRGMSRATGALVVGALAAVLGVVALGDMVAVVFVAVALVCPLALPAVRHLEF